MARFRITAKSSREGSPRDGRSSRVLATKRETSPHEGTIFRVRVKLTTLGRAREALLRSMSVLEVVVVDVDGVRELMPGAVAEYDGRDDRNERTEIEAGAQLVVAVTLVEVEDRAGREAAQSQAEERPREDPVAPMRMRLSDGGLVAADEVLGPAAQQPDLVALTVADEGSIAGGIDRRDARRGPRLVGSRDGAAGVREQRRHGEDGPARLRARHGGTARASRSSL